MTFLNEIEINSRKHAAFLLGEKLMPYKNANACVVAIPEGGAPIGYWLSTLLNISFDVMPCQMITIPGKESKSIGSISVDDVCVHEIEGVPQSFIYHQIQLIRNTVESDYTFYESIKELTNFHNKTVIVVDDVLWNSDAMLASLRSIQRQNPTRIIVAVPFITDEAAFNIRKEVDDLFFLYKSRYAERIRKLGSAFPHVTREDVKKFLLQSITP